MTNDEYNLLCCRRVSLERRRDAEFSGVPSLIRRVPRSSTAAAESLDCSTHATPRPHEQHNMPPSKAFVPSVALIRALFRPLPRRCPFARPIATPFIREKRTKAAKNLTDAQVMEKAIAKLAEDDDKWIDEPAKPMTLEELEGDDFPVVSWYEQDLDKGTPRVLISRMATAEDRKKNNDMLLMIQESYRNPDYDDRELNHRMIDDLLENPNFAGLTEELKAIKGEIRSKAEQEQMIKDAEAEAAQKIQDFDTRLLATIREGYEKLLNDPDAAVAHEELRQVLDNMPEKVADLTSPEFEAIVDKMRLKLHDDARFQKKMEGMKGQEEVAMKEFRDIEREMEREKNEILKYITEVDESIEMMNSDNPAPDLEPLLIQMRDVLQSMGTDSRLTAEMDAILAEDPRAKQEGDIERWMDAEELTNLGEEMLKKAYDKQSQAIKDKEEDLSVSAELQAKVDKIMEDPRLMEKLAYIQKIISETERKKQPYITTIAHEVAPDPYELEDSRTATIKQQLQAAHDNPEHSAALGRLRVNLSPPFHISPALKSFNQAIELAYVGANDDIRRVLWRCYQKARTLPTFLQNVSDEAWDIIYYSQAVTWGANQNRYDHLRTILADLKSLGRNGPPTHPSTLAASGDAEHLETR
jgi:hypothetical protein